MGLEVLWFEIPAVQIPDQCIYRLELETLMRGRGSNRRLRGVRFVKHVTKHLYTEENL